MTEQLKPPGKPLPPVRHVSQTVRLAAPVPPGSKMARVHIPDPEVFEGDEEPTRPQGVEFRVALIAKYFRDCAVEDQAYLLKLAEGFAARNAKT